FIEGQRRLPLPLNWGFTPSPTAGPPSFTPKSRLFGDPEKMRPLRLPRAPGVNPLAPHGRNSARPQANAADCASDSRPYLVDKTADRMLSAWYHHPTGFIEPSE